MNLQMVTDCLAELERMKVRLRAVRQEICLACPEEAPTVIDLTIDEPETPWMPEPLPDQQYMGPWAHMTLDPSSQLGESWPSIPSSLELGSYLILQILPEPYLIVLLLKLIIYVLKF